MILNIIKKLIPSKLFKLLQPAYHFLFAWLANVVYGRPSEKLIVIGVTGTTGKTTSIYLIAKMLEAAGFRVGYTTTALFSDGKKEWANDKKMTMAGRFFVQKMLYRMLKNKCQFAIVETTSEGIVQFRHRFINYDILVFTGLYPEHIESHGSFENYKQAKGKLFAHLKRCKTKYTDNNRKIVNNVSNLAKTELSRIKKTIIVNGDDEHADYFLSFWAEEKIAYSRDRKSFGSGVDVLKYGGIKIRSNGVSFKTVDMNVDLQIVGDFNVVNSMISFSIAKTLGIFKNKVKNGLEKITGIAGRFEKIDEGQDFLVVVDYAYEPRAVEKLYEVVETIKHNKIIHVLGSCGGGRDVARRPILGKLAGEKADIVIVTNEDPYDDDPEIIIDQVALGAERSGKKDNKDLFKIADRETAIKKAIKLAQKGDVVLITGKGNEQYICVEYGKKIPWDDRVVVRKLLKELKSRE